MNKELLLALEMIEKEKNISKETMLEAILQCMRKKKLWKRWKIP